MSCSIKDRVLSRLVFSIITAFFIQCLVLSTAFAQSTCNIHVMGTEISGSFEPGSQITFQVDVASNCAENYYYRFSYHPDYGTANYTGANWKLMAETEYISENNISFSFPEPGNYIVVVWIVSDVDNVNPESVTITGWSVKISG